MLERGTTRRHWAAASAAGTLLALAGTVGCQTAAHGGRGGAEIDRAGRDRVERLLSEMTLEEKVGQMMQLTLQTVSSQPGLADQEHQLNEAEARRLIVEYGTGSILNNYDVAFDPAYWREIVGTLQQLATEETRLGIPLIYGIDSVHGANYVNGATIFPHNLTLAATWNPELARTAGEITAAETRSVGLTWNFAPVCDIARMPTWSRTFETFGEDPYLAGVLAAATIEGMQGDDLSAPTAVAATGKHFLGYSVPRTGRDRTPAYISDSEMAEIFIPPFEMAFDVGVRTVMVNSGEVNGVPVHADPRILTELLRDDMGFEGVVVTDWADIDKLVNYHKVAPNEKEATYLAVTAGIDVAMTPLTTSFADLLVELVEEGRIRESRIDESVRRILSLKEELGLFESQIPSRRDRAEIGSTASNAASLEAARQGITLLRNGGSLPLGDGTRILVTGPTSDSKVALHGSWSYSWQGTDERLYPPSDTVLDAVRERFGSGNVVHVPGVEYEEAIDIDAAVRAARGVDVVLLCLGELPAVEKPGDFGSLMMSAPQVELAQALAATGKPVILSLVTNRPRILSEFESDLDSILWLGHAGPHGGTALAEILAGDVNPSGRLPFSYPRHPNALLTYDHKHSERVGADSSTPNGYDPLFQFGFGIGYSEIGYSGLRVRELAGGGVNVTVSVRNSGDRDAAEVVQVYVTDAVSSVTPRVKRLKAFERTEIAAGASDRVGFVLPRDAFMTVDRDGNAVFEPGEFVISVGGLTETIVLD